MKNSYESGQLKHTELRLFYYRMFTYDASVPSYVSDQLIDTEPNLYLIISWSLSTLLFLTSCESFVNVSIIITLTQPSFSLLN